MSVITAAASRYTTRTTQTVGKHTCSTFEIIGNRYACAHNHSKLVRAARKAGGRR